MEYKIRSNSMKTWNRIFYGLGIIPWIYIIPLLAFYFHAWIELGRFPYYNNPDPKDLEIYHYYGVISFPAIFITGYAFLSWIFLSIIYFIVKRKQLIWKPWIFSFLSQFLLLLILNSKITEWFLD